MLPSFILVISLLFSQCSYGQSSQEWTKEQRELAAVLAVELVADWHTTRNLARGNWCYQPVSRDHTCWELNPILGQYPAVSRVDNHFLAVGLAVYTLVEFVPEYRTLIPRTSVITEGLAVSNNVIRFGWQW